MRKTGNEVFLWNNQELESNVKDFWAWAYSDLIGNTERGKLAEYIVAMAINEHHGESIPWNKYDLQKGDTTIEVKSSAYVQTWKQNKLSTISFDIAETFGWDYEINKMENEKKRQADVYVFCVLTPKVLNQVNPLKLEQWDFYVLNTKILNDQVKTQKNITLNKILKLGAIPCTYPNLNTVIECITKKGEITGEILFNDLVPIWGLRGDPYLYEEYRLYYKDQILNYSVDEFENHLNHLFELFTGSSLNDEESIYVEKYAHGGMSSGMIHVPTWKQTILPMIKKRYLFLLNNRT